MIAWLKRASSPTPALIERCEPWPPPPTPPLAQGTAEQLGEAIEDRRATIAGGVLDISVPAASPAAPLNGWENVSRITRADAAPLRRRLALSRDFDLDAHNIVWDADQKLLRGESIDLDHVATLIAEQVRKNLQFVFEPAPERR